MQVQFIFVYLGLLCKFDCSFGVPSWCTSAFERGLKKVDFCTKKAHFLPKSTMTGVWEAPSGSPLCKAENTKKWYFMCPVMVMPKVLVGSFKNWIFGPKTAFWTRKRATLAILGQKRACRVAKWASTWIMNVSKVALVCAYSMSTQEWMLLGKKRYAIWL